jgi:hypothetical protein
MYQPHTCVPTVMIVPSARIPQLEDEHLGAKVARGLLRIMTQGEEIELEIVPTVPDREVCMCPVRTCVCIVCIRKPL